jgi:hypothetical protein
VACTIVGFLFFLALIFIKPLMAVIAILTGNKESLSDFGNFCEEKVPWRDTFWTPEEKGEEPPPEPQYKWRKVGEKEGDAQ